MQAGTKRIMAVGTQFSVRLDDEDVRVVVTEGVVQFEDADTNATLPTGRETRTDASAATLTAGAIARATAARTIIQNASLTEPEDLLSWRTGFVIFRDTALADAIAEFNRYNERKIVIPDPQVVAMRLTKAPSSSRQWNASITGHRLNS